MGRRGSPMVRSARPIQYIVSGLPTFSSATAERRPLTPRTTTQVRLFQQLLDKQTGALLVLPQGDTFFAVPPLSPLFSCSVMTARCASRGSHRSFNALGKTFPFSSRDKEERQIVRSAFISTRTGVKANWLSRGESEGHGCRANTSSPANSL